MTITATRTPSTGTSWVGSRLRRACSRCGRTRQVNSGRVPAADLCTDCQSTDPHVWNRDVWEPWDGTEGDDDE